MVSLQIWRVIMSNFTLGFGIGTIYMKREEIVYNVFESELDMLSVYNHLSTAAFSFGSMFLYKAIESIDHPFLETYHWYLLVLLPFLCGVWFLYKKRGLTSYIKKKSVVIKFDEIK